jgi:hypothetical protein
VVGDALASGYDRARLEEYLEGVDWEAVDVEAVDLEDVNMEAVDQEAVDGRRARCCDSIPQLVNV